MDWFGKCADLSENEVPRPQRIPCAVFFKNLGRNPSGRTKVNGTISPNISHSNIWNAAFHNWRCSMAGVRINHVRHSFSWGPAPAFGERGEIGGVGGGGFFVGAVGAGGFPAAATFVQNAFQEDAGRFVGSALGAGKFGFRGDQAAFDGRFQDRRPIAFQVSLDPFQQGHRFVQPRKVVFDCRHDSVLFLNWRYWELVLSDIARPNRRVHNTLKSLANVLNKLVTSYPVEYPFRQNVTI